MPSSVLVLLADGFEEIELICPVDLLRRAGATVVMASCENSLEVTGRSSICIRADRLLSEIDSPMDFDLLILPGGPAVFELRKRNGIISLVSDFAGSAKPDWGNMRSASAFIGCTIAQQRKTVHGSYFND